MSEGSPARRADYPSAFRLPPWSSCALLRRALNGARDPDVGAAAADVRAHVFHDFVPARVALLFKQACGAHDLAGLAVAALRHLLRQPGLLQRMTGIRRQPLD